ncbi:MAG: copper resistance protein B [Xanthomonadales bacterium]|nr:copper resistance protein B [Xanthomonadales bacterium]
MHRHPCSIALVAALALAAGSAQAQQHDHSQHGTAPAESESKVADQATVDHSQHDEASTQTPRTPIPPITDADREAAEPPAHAHDHGSGVFSYLLFDRLETWDAEPGNGQAWEAQAWIGSDRHRLWLRSEGERSGGHTESADIEVLYGRPIARWWDLVAGVRHDIAPGDDQNFAAIGVIGMAPYKFEVEATAYLGASGQTAARIEAEYELLLTNRLILQPVIEAEWHGRRDASRGIGAGLGKIETGLRLRYEFTRRFAPYVGLVHERSFGATAGFRRDEGEAVEDTRVVAGARLWF